MIKMDRKECKQFIKIIHQYVDRNLEFFDESHGTIDITHLGLQRTYLFKDMTKIKICGNFLIIFLRGEYKGMKEVVKFFNLTYVEEISMDHDIPVVTPEEYNKTEKKNSESSVM